MFCLTAWPWHSAPSEDDLEVLLRHRKRELQESRCDGTKPRMIISSLACDATDLSFATVKRSYFITHWDTKEEEAPVVLKL